MTFEALKPEDVLRDSAALEEYTQTMDYFAIRELLPLNANIYILEQIAEFPLWDFMTVEDSLFFRITANNTLSMSILSITRLTTDTVDDARTLRKFKNRMSLALIKPEYRDKFHEQMKRVKFDPIVDNLIERAKVLRDYEVAHHIVVQPKTGTSAKPLKITPLTLDELKKIRDALVKLFDILSLNVEYMLAPPSYSPYVQHPDPNHKPDIVQLLEHIAIHSALVEALRTDPYERVVLREQRSAEEIASINAYLQKLGLPQI